MSTPTIKDIRAAAAKRRATRQRNRRVLIGGGLSLLVVVVLSWWVLPGIVRRQIEEQGGEFTGRSVTVEKVALNPFTLAVEISGFEVRDRDGGELLAWTRLMVNANLWATLTGNWGLDAIELEGLRGRLFMTEDGELNVADLIEKLGASESEAESRPLVVTRLDVTDAELSLADSSRSRPFATTIGPLTFSITEFHTKFDPEAPYTFEASTEAGESLRWRGTLSVKPLKSAGEFLMSGIQVPKYEAYFAELIPFEVEAGVVSASGSYELEWTEELPELKLRGGEASITGVGLRARDGHWGQQSLASLEIDGVEVDLQAGRFAVATVVAADGALELRRSEAGLDLMGFPLAAAAAEAGASESEATKVWPDITLGAFKAERLRLRLRDETLAEPHLAGLNVGSLTTGRVALADPAAAVTLAMEASFPLGGRLEIEGQTSIEPFSPDLAVRLADFSLAAAADHVRAITELELIRGAVQAEGRLGQTEKGLGFAGEVGVVDLSVLDSSGETLAGFGALDLNGLDFRIAPTALSVAAVSLHSPEAHLRINQEGLLNLPGPAAEDSSATAVETAPVALPEIEIGKITLDGARLSWRDESVIETATVSLDELAGELEGWSSRDVGRAKVSMSGKVNGVAPFRMTGDLNPLGRPAHADLAIEVDQVNLMPTRGYVGQYTGFELDEGSLSLDIAFQLRDRAIESDTMTVLDRFTLGARTESPDAMSLPFKLGVALLKDPAGEIVIDVPVAGHLDDPEFRIGRVVWRVITNLLTKAATSPFALLGGIVGGEDEVDLQHHVFDSGQASFPPETLESLALLVTALEARPAINIAVQGEYDAETDPAGLRPVVLENQLRQQATEDAFTAEGTWAARAREAALVSLYQVVFGQPPIDPTGELPPAVPVSEPAVEEPEPLAAPDAVETADNQTLLSLIRRWFRREQEPANTPEVVIAEPGVPPSSFPLPEGIEPELPVLPMAEIEDRLLEHVQVPEVMLWDLAKQRAAATRDHLIAAGVASERITLVDPAGGEARVTLDLR